MFFFFFNEHLYNDEIVRQAFRQVCLDKMLIDGYCDMRRYTDGKTDRSDFYIRLKNARSGFADLFKRDYPHDNNILDVWHSVVDKFADKLRTRIRENDAYPENYDGPREYVRRGDNYEPITETERRSERVDVLSSAEADAIVYWVYQVFDKNERLQITRRVFEGEKQLHAIDYRIEYAHDIPYNAKKIEPAFVGSVSDFYSVISGANIPGRLFYRGHSDANYLLLPSLFRSQKLLKNERKMYNELLIQCPGYFPYGSTHLDKLVEMQHYGLPTRLLDITSNPLVALYFACGGDPNSLGEVILISAEEDAIKIPEQRLRVHTREPAAVFL